MAKGYRAGQHDATEGSITPRVLTGKHILPERAHLMEELKGTAVASEGRQRYGK